MTDLRTSSLQPHFRETQPAPAPVGEVEWVIKFIDGDDQIATWTINATWVSLNGDRFEATTGDAQVIMLPAHRFVSAVRSTAVPPEAQPA